MAFRNIPLHPSVHRFVAIMLNGLVHLDLALNFGERSAPGIWGNIADAMVEIYLHHGIHVLYWNG